MMFNKRKKIDETLSLFFKDEAADITPPSSQKLWGDLEGRLANEEIPALPVQGRPEKSPGSHSWLKNKPLVAMVAASFVLIIFFVRVPPAPSLQQFVLNLFSSAPMENQMQSYDTIGEGGIPSGNKELPSANLKTAEDLQQQQRIMMAEEKAPLTGTGEGKQDYGIKAETENSEEVDMLYEGDYFTTRAVKKELTWDKQPVFAATLGNNKNLAPEKIWIISNPPEGFSFHEGSIVKTENFLFQVTHQFINGEGNMLTLRQDFFLNKEEMEPFPLTENGVADPKQVGPFGGFLFRQEDGLNILTWKQESSIVTLSGQIEEKLLLSIPNSLKTD